MHGTMNIKCHVLFIPNLRFFQEEMEDMETYSFTDSVEFVKYSVLVFEQ
jgi:hypothetical protein